MENTFFENLISNFWFALIALIIVTLICHLTMVYPKNLSKRQWKKVDYFWISLTVLGLIGSTRVAEKTVIDTKNNQIKFLISISAKRLLTNISPENSAGICRTFVKTDHSPDDLVELQKNFDKACDWKNKVTQIVLNSIDTVNFDTINLKDIPSLKVNEPTVNEYKMQVLFDIKNYNKWSKVLKKNKVYIEKNVSDYLLIYLSPILLIIGLSIRITKVTGELMYEKKKNEV